MKEGFGISSRERKKKAKKRLADRGVEEEKQKKRRFGGVFWIFGFFISVQGSAERKYFKRGEEESW